MTRKHWISIAVLATLLGGIITWLSGVESEAKGIQQETVTDGKTKADHSQKSKPLGGKPPAAFRSPTLSATKQASDLVRRYDELVEYWRKRRPSGGQAEFDKRQKSSDERPREVLKDGWFYQVEKRHYRSARNLKKMVFHDNGTGLIYPGAPLWTQPLLRGSLMPVLTPARPEIKVTMEDARLEDGVSPAFQYDGTNFDFRKKSHKVVNRIKAPATRLTLEIKTGKSLESALLKMGLSAKFWVAKLSVSSSSKATEQRSFAVISLHQVYYTMVADMRDPNVYAPVELAGKDDVGLILKRMKHRGEIGYIRKVSYGRRVLIAVSAVATEDKLRRALKFSFGAWGIKTKGKLDSETRKVWETMDARAVIIGGTADKSLADVVTGGPEQFLKHVNTYLKASTEWNADKTEAVPVSFEVRYCSDNEPVANYETVEFAGHIVTGRKRAGETVKCDSVNVELTKKDAKLIHGDEEIHTDDWTRVGVSYQFRVSKDRRRVELHLIMDAYECESDGNYHPEKNDNRTHIRTSRIVNVYELAEDDPRSIKKVIAQPLAASDKRKFGGHLHSWFTYGNGQVGALRDIQVHVDGKGRNDLERQGLKAIISFAVEIDRER